jgi:hypothetical protein
MSKPTKPEVDLTMVFLLLMELACVAVLLVGVWLVFPPAAFIAGGICGIYGLERAIAGHARNKAAEQAENVRTIGRIA